MDYHPTPSVLSADIWDRLFAKMAALEDTRDFDGLYLLNLHGMYRAAGCSFRRNSQDRGALRREERLTPGNE